MTEQQKSLRERDGDIANNWYVICLSRELGNDKPIQRTLYDTPYVIWRDKQGKPAILPDRCLHRHTFISMGGWLKDGRVCCPYHGWEYNREGQVEHIPSEGPESQVERKLCLKPVPCYEQDGAIWAWMGEGEPTTELPPWRFPNYGKDGWHHYYMVTDFKGEVTDLCENFMDVPHTVFVHKGWFRDKKDQKVPMTVETNNGTVLCTYNQEDDEFSWAAKMLLNPGGHPMKHTDKFIYPNLTSVDYWFGENGFIINSQVSPVGTLNSRVYTYIAYKVNMFGSLIKPIISYYTREVINQDVDIMINQGGSLAVDSHRTYRSTPADELHIQIERLRRYGQLGDEKLMTFKTKKEVEFWI